METAIEYKQTYEEQINKFKSVIEKTLPQFYKEVGYRLLLGGAYIRIVIAASERTINRVQGQHPQCVSLMYDLRTQELTIRVYGGNGGQYIYTIPAKNLNLAMERIKIPFRKAKTEQSALKALEKFCINYKNALIENRENLKYQDIVNYTQVLS